MRANALLNTRGRSDDGRGSQRLGRLLRVGCVMGLGLSLALGSLAPFSDTAVAQQRNTGGAFKGMIDAPDGGEGDQGAMDADVLQRLFAEAGDGVGDQHLPFVLARLKKALADQDMLGFLDLVDPAYFSSQFQLLAREGRSPGETLGQFSCEFFSICDISKTYGFNDIVSADVIGVAGGYDGAGLVEVRLQLRMWDGLTLIAPVFYDRNSARLSAAVG